ncbi:MAG: hypothetical protein FWB93_01035 [Oscillospiraceae bacterium]|nr:hypothetical protein [Oscillospiraceae bacterium]
MKNSTKRLSIILLVMAMITLLFAGCNGGEPPEPTIPPGRVVARIGDIDITHQEYRFFSLTYQAYLDEEHPGWRDQPNADRRLREGIELQIREEYVYMILAAEFGIVPLTRDTLPINRYIESVESRWNTIHGPGGFDRFLEESFMTPMVFRRQAMIYFFYSRSVQAHVSNLENGIITYSPELVQAWAAENSGLIDAFYEANVRVKQISIEINEMFMPLNEANSILREMRSRLLETETIEEKDALFTELMIERGVDPRLAEIGTYFQPGHFPITEMNHVVDALAVGEVSELYLHEEEMIGFLILRLDNDRDGIASLFYNFLMTEAFLIERAAGLQFEWVGE